VGGSERQSLPRMPSFTVTTPASTNRHTTPNTTNMITDIDSFCRQGASLPVRRPNRGAPGPPRPACAPLVERGVVVGDAIDALPLVRLPIDDDTAHYRLPPTLGEHTGEVLREAGFTEVEIAQLTTEPARI
jgi:hypothetical protein